MSVYPNTISVSGGTFPDPKDFVFVSETGTQFRYRKSGDTNNTTDIYFDTSDSKWYDGSAGGQPSGFWNQTADSSGTLAGNPSVACSYLDIIKMTNGGSSGNRGTFTHPTITSGSAGGGAPPPGQQIGTDGITNVQFTKLSDSSIELGFDWQNISTYTVFTDRGGTITSTTPSVTGSSGTVTGYTGSGVHALTGLNEGDRVWVENSVDVNGYLPVYIHYFIDWSYNSSTKKVIAKAFFQDNGGSGFGQSADVGLALFFGSTWSTGFSLGAAVADPTNWIATYDGTLKTLTLDANRGTTWGVINVDASQYGSSFRIPIISTSRNFW